MVHTASLRKEAKRDPAAFAPKRTKEQALVRFSEVRVIVSF